MQQLTCRLAYNMNSLQHSLSHFFWGQTDPHLILCFANALAVQHAHRSVLFKLRFLLPSRSHLNCKQFQTSYKLLEVRARHNAEQWV